VVEREEPEMSVEGDAGLGVPLDMARVAQTTFRVLVRFVQGRGLVLGRLVDDKVMRPGPDDTFEDAAIATASGKTVAAYLDAASTGGTRLTIGRLQGAPDAPSATLQAAGFGRHTFLCDQSGSGKTYSLGVILERLLAETDLRLVIIDPNSDYVRLGDVREPGATGDTAPAERQRYREAVADLVVLRPAGRAGGPADHLKLRFSDLSPRMQAIVLQLDPLRDRDEYGAYWTIVRQMGRDRYSLNDVLAHASANLAAESRQVALRITKLRVGDWDIWAEADEPSLTDLNSAWRAVVLDVGGFQEPAEKCLVAAALFGALWRQRDDRRPVPIVIDEAHNICPQEPDDPIQAIATERVVTIAGEGRKFGRYLLLSTQQPHKIHANVVAQCDNLVLMRMNSAEDVQHLSRVFSFVPPALIDRARTFGQGESLVAGKIVPVPLLIRFGQRFSQEGGSDVADTWTRRGHQ
jgi:hypothetical protein